MPKEYTLTIITINRNNQVGLRCTLESVRSQQGLSSPVEYVVVDGGSTDGSAALLTEFSDIITHSVSERDNGIYNAMNKGVCMASGDYLLFLNSGDTLASNTVLHELEGHTLTGDVVVGLVNTVKDGRVIGRNHTVWGGEVTLFSLLLTGIPHQGSLTRRELLIETPFDESCRINADFKFFLQRLIIEGRSVQYIPTTISNYGLDGISSTNTRLMQQEREEIYRDLVPERIRRDYDRAVPHYYETVRINWLLHHPFFYSVYRAWCTVGRKILK